MRSTAPTRRGRGLRGGLAPLLVVAGVLAMLAGGCKTIPADSYGVSRLRFHGVDELDDAALRACLATRQRNAFQIDIGTSSDLSCNEPPFDGGRVPIRLVTWPWTTWPTYDEAVFERDLDRIERWYRARGFYDARVDRATFDPPSARDSDELPPVGEAPCERRGNGHGCALEIDVYVTEGQPVTVRNLDVRGLEPLHRRIRERIRHAVQLHVGDRFDEALHDRTKTEMITAMREGGFACADVIGAVALDPTQRIADVSYTLRPGETSHFRDVRVEVSGDATGIPLGVVRAIAGIRRGEAYAPSRLSLAQRDIYAVGSFAAVEVEAVPVREGDGGEGTLCGSEVDVVVRVTPGREVRWGLGAGIDSGNVTYSAMSIAQTPVPQWNVHLLGRFEHRNFFGGLRRLRIEERPKITFQGVFPSPRDPAPGNEISVEFRQPAFIERATLLSISGRHDYGLDGNYRDTLRHQFDLGTAVSRPFVRGRNSLSALIGVYGNAYLVQRSTVENLPNYAISFFREYLSFDRRDNPHSPHRGLLATIDMQQAGLAKLASWTYFRFQPEFRGFIPLPARFTLAGRFAMGATFFTHNRNQADIHSPSSQVLGPTAYRLRGGGPNSHRGYIAGQLGDLDDCAFLPPGDPASCVGLTGGYDPSSSNVNFRPIDGGLRKWEASIELRSQITDSFGAVVFADMGDVDRGRWIGTASPTPDDPGRVVYSATRAPRFRFNQPHLALGFGLRYYTIVGPLRLDFAFRVPGAQAFGSGVDATRAHSLFGRGHVQGAVSLTIGEAF